MQVFFIVRGNHKIERNYQKEKTEGDDDDVDVEEKEEVTDEEDEGYYNTRQKN